jgi:hypothetical protein
VSTVFAEVSADAHAYVDWEGKARKGIVCYHCGKIGHIKRDCRKFLVEQAEETCVQMAYCGLATHKPLEWFVDSGASHHVCVDTSAITEHRDVSNRTVKGANCQTVPVLGMGSVHLVTDVDSRRTSVWIHDVLFAPGFVSRIISVSGFAETGATLAFSRTSCTLARGQDTCAVAFAVRSLYKLNCMVMLSQQQHVLMSVDQQTTRLWHLPFGHLGYDNLARLVRHGIVEGVPLAAPLFSESNGPCEACALAKQLRLPFKTSASTSTRVLQLIYRDVMGPFAVTSIGCAKCAVTFLDDYSKQSVVKPLAYKSQVAGVLKAVVTMLETQKASPCRGGECVNKELAHYFAGKGIVHETTVGYAPQSNGATECLNRTLMERMRGMLKTSGAASSLWAEAIVTASYLRNRSPASATLTQTLWELGFGSKPNVSHLRVYGATASAFVPPQQRGKLSDCSRKGVMVGYSAQSNGYRIVLDGTRTVLNSRDVTFVESALMCPPQSPPKSNSEA